MRVSKDKAAANRRTLVEEAGRLFRARGVDGVGVAEIAKAAGLTHGALYAHFASKEALSAEALRVGLERSHDLLTASAGSAEPSLSGYLDFLLSPGLRDTVEMGCPLTASASEIARQTDDVSAEFTIGIERMIETLAVTMERVSTAEERRRIAITAIAAEIGAIAMARGVAKHDPTLSDEILASVRTELGKIDPTYPQKRSGNARS